MKDAPGEWFTVEEMRSKVMEIHSVYVTGHVVIRTIQDLLFAMPEHIAERIERMYEKNIPVYQFMYKIETNESA